MRPKAHYDLSQQVEKILSGSSATISEFMGNVADMLRHQGIDVEDIEGRPKSLASIRAKQAPFVNGTASKVC
jgi:(p)ppGpp synthase/HD superfamily hydrolase